MLRDDERPPSWVVGSEIAVCLPPFSTNPIEDLLALMSERARLVLPASWVRANPTRASQLAPRRLSLLAEPVDYDDPVDLVLESELERFSAFMPLDRVFSSIGVATSQSLIESMAEGARYPDHDYLTPASLRRVATAFPMSWGGNLSLNSPDWLFANLPPESTGLFVVCENAFEPASFLHEQFNTVPQNELGDVVSQTLDLLAEWMSA